MKKIYIIPELQLTEIHCEKLIAESLLINSQQTTSTQYVKENPAAGRQDYNVWNDDWSNWWLTVQGSWLKVLCKQSEGYNH